MENTFPEIETLSELKEFCEKKIGFNILYKYLHFYLKIKKKIIRMLKIYFVIYNFFVNLYNFLKKYSNLKLLERI